MCSPELATLQAAPPLPTALRARLPPVSLSTVKLNVALGDHWQSVGPGRGTTLTVPTAT